MAIIQGNSSSQLVLKVTWKLLKMFSDKLSELRTCSRSVPGTKEFHEYHDKRKNVIQFESLFFEEERWQE